MKSDKIKFLAYYLPQYHQIPENDEWWGEGFTEWTNVKKAKPLFKGHKQPIFPGELGYYDLLKTEGIQEKQANLAKEYGIDGFIYYSYWFGDGKMLLEKPADKMLANKKVDIPFCFCWANETWKGIWHGLDNPDVLVEQIYPGVHDYINYFNYLLPFFKDARYIKLENKPMFHIYRIDDVPDADKFLETFNKLAVENGFNGIYFISTLNYNSQKALSSDLVYGMVGIDTFRHLRYMPSYYFKSGTRLNTIEYYVKRITGQLQIESKSDQPNVINYKKGLRKLRVEIPHKKFIPCVIPNWDNSPRSNNKSLIFKNVSPNAFKKYLIKTIDEFSKHPANPPFIVIKSWNEWAEGNYIEPDKRYGRKWLEVFKVVRKHFNI